MIIIVSFLTESAVRIEFLTSDICRNSRRAFGSANRIRRFASLSRIFCVLSFRSGFGFLAAAREPVSRSDRRE